MLFETALLVFDDPNLLMIQDRVVDGEERWQTIGLVKGQLLLLVAHAVTDEEDDAEIVRIISAREVMTYERKIYEEGQ